MYHAVACLTVPKLSYLREHSEVSQARSLHACWTCFLDNRSDRCSTVRYMYVERHVDIYFLATNKICSLSTLNKIKLPTSIDSVLFVTLVWVKTNFIFSCIVQSIESQGKNSTIKSNTILSILISCLPRNY